MRPSALQPVSNDTVFEQVATGLRDKGFSIVPDALPTPVIDCLAEGVTELPWSEFHRAGIGRGPDQDINSFVRRDVIHWIEPEHGHLRPWLNWSESLRVYLNRRLYLGLFSFESHFAIYRQGDYYKRHLDAFRGESNRMVSLVTYLNRGWEPDQGGELVMYLPDRESIKVAPAYGTVVAFLSEEVPHEVLRAERQRYSVAGWYRLNTSLLTQIDPPT